MILILLIIAGMRKFSSYPYEELLIFWLVLMGILLLWSLKLTVSWTPYKNINSKKYGLPTAWPMSSPHKIGKHILKTYKHYLNKGDNMITLSYKDINKAAFLDGISKLADTPFHLKTAYHIGRINDKVKSELNHAQVLWAKEIGKIEWEEIPATETMPAGRKPKDPEALKTLEEQFLAIEFTIDKHKVNVSELGEAKLLPVEVLALEPLLTGLESLENGGENGKEESV